jgi:hypothetical protein
VTTWLALRIGFGVAGGALFGLILAWFLQSPKLIPEGYENIVTLGGVLLLYSCSEIVLSESGILAVTIAGIVVGNFQTRVGKELRRFEEQLTVMMIGLLFVLLAADVRISDVTDLGWRGLATVGALMFLVRPAKVFLSTLRADLAIREKLFLCWLAPRGIVAAAIASLVAGVMEKEGIPGGTELRALVFLTIAITVVVQGGTSGWVSRLLGLRSPPRDAVAILGAEGIGLALANELRSAGSRVVFFDSNAAHCQAAEDEGYSVVFGNALDTRLLTRGRIDQAAVSIGLTANSAANSLFARESVEDFAVPEVYVAVASDRPGVTQHRVEQQRGKVLFDSPKDLERWNVRFRHGEAVVEYFRYMGRPPVAEGEGVDTQKGPLGDGRGERWVLLTIHRDKASKPMHVGLEPKEGDIGAFVLHVPAAEEARSILVNLGWEKLPQRAEA